VSESSSAALKREPVVEHRRQLGRIPSPATLFVRSQPRDMPASQVVEAAVATGIFLDAAYVSRVRGHDAAIARKALERAQRQPKAAKPKAKAKPKRAAVALVVPPSAPTEPASTARVAIEKAEGLFRMLVLRLGLERCQTLMRELETLMEGYR
jgi:hypothetical protein